ncbi:MAG: hypothetical protein JO227_01550 [Acetobacteraceae bacterium]|nr:hypothetical protein [Acetobacteraceae bacterium]
MKKWSYVLLPALAGMMLTAVCNSEPKTLAADAEGAAYAAQTAPASATGARYVSAAPLSNSTATATISDPTLNNMAAATLTIPAGWKMQGMMLTSPCTTLPQTVFRAYSPDALMQMRFEPAIGWSWRASQNLGTPQGCLPLRKQITAAQFLDYYTGTIPGGVHVVGPITLPEDQKQGVAQRAAKLNELGARSPVMAGITNTGDLAAVRIETVNGSFVIEERLRAIVACQLNNNPSFAQGGDCYAQVDELMAPKGQLDSLIRVVDGNQLPRAKASDQWFQAKLRQQNQQWTEFGAKLRALYQAESRMLAERAQQFSQMMAQNHAAYMQQQESEFRSTMANANARMNARSNAASDWVDYALDQQTVAVGGGTAKVSSSYSQTWTNGTQWYQTNDPNSNPNGVLQGNWTLATPVHGNGQPK